MFDRFTTWLDDRLIAQWRQSWKFTSTHLAAVFAAISAVLMANPSTYLALVGLLPSDGIVRVAVITGLVIFLFVVPVLVRLWNQEKPNDGK